MNGIFHIPEPKNEPIKSYGPKSEEKTKLKEEIKRQKSQPIEIPLIIGGKEIRTGNMGKAVCPHNHGHILANYHRAGKEEAHLAVKSALAAKDEWELMPYESRAAIFLKAAELLAGKYRYVINAATMLNQSKNAYQAEIDSACELIDFWRFNPYWAQFIYSQQPNNLQGIWNRMEHRPLEGFVFAITPFNFTAIGGNLPTSPALMGNVSLWKPAETAVLSSYYIMKVLQEAGMPDGVINFIPGPSQEIGSLLLQHPELAGVHFTGSTEVFHHIWKTIGNNIASYKSYPRIVGETGGKDFVFVHPSADLDAVAIALVRGAYEYQGQKCSAASRTYIPQSLWPKLKDRLIGLISELKMGDVEDFSNFVNAIIDKRAFAPIVNYIDFAKNSNDAKILVGGKSNDSVGYFIEPTLIQAMEPRFKTMVEEIFGPVLTAFVYHDNDYEKTLELCNTTSPYALTGSIFSQDRKAIVHASQVLRHAAGNFYINDKPTGAMVSQQPFGGGRASGTNDKAGSYTNLLRWVSPRTIKETFDPPKDYHYPFMLEP